MTKRPHSLFRKSGATLRIREITAAMGVAMAAGLDRVLAEIVERSCESGTTKTPPAAPTGR